MPLVALRLAVSKADAERIASHLDEDYWPQPLSVSLFEISGEGKWEIEAHFDPAPDMEKIAAALALALGGQPPPDFSIAEIVDRDWIAQSLKGLDPVRAGRFFVHGAHDRHQIPGGAIAVEIDAGQAFGTGHHETTKGCLEALSDIVREGRPRRILDVGTGSGILAIAAAKLLKTQVLATDNDPIAIAVARVNARINGVARFFTGVVAEGIGHREADRPGGYDLIFANILARPLIHLAGDLAGCLAGGGSVILSGILDTQSQSVLAAYRSHGLVLRQRIPIGDWTTLVIGK